MRFVLATAIFLGICGPVLADSLNSERKHTLSEEAYFQSILNPENLSRLESRAPLTLANHPPGYRLVFVWASWCAFCDRARVQLEQFQRAAGDMPFEIIGVSPEDSEEAARNYAKDKNSSLRMFYSRNQDKNLMPESLRIYPSFGLIDPKGKLVAAYTGLGPEILSNIEKKIRWVLQEELQ